MTRLAIRDFESKDLPASAALLAARQKRDRARLPVLSAALESVDACEGLLASLLQNTRSSGVVSLAEGVVNGFLFGEKMTLAPTEFASMFFAPHSISMPVYGHAVADGSDVTEVYRALYAELAGRWVFAMDFSSI